VHTRVALQLRMIDARQCLLQSFFTIDPRPHCSAHVAIELGKNRVA
jgi:hypothetical protein